MILITPEETSSPLNEDIERLQTNLRGFARDIENLQERVQSGDVTDAETRKVFSDLRSWLRMAMETEKALAQQNRQRLEIDGDYGLDLDAARDQIGCRLARLRPLLPCHLRWQEIAEGWKITWTRRGRIYADTWEGVDIPLGEESELYRLRVLRDGQDVMEFTTTTPQAVISNAHITALDLDLQHKHISIEVSQISNAYGPGIAAVMEMG